MSAPKSSTSEVRVRVVRPGAGDRDYHLSDGATLADLLCASGFSTAGEAVFVDGVLTAEALRLHDGAVVTIVPRTGDDEPWRATVSAFRDEAIFQEYSEALKARRQEVEPVDGSGE